MVKNARKLLDYIDQYGSGAVSVGTNQELAKRFRVSTSQVIRWLKYLKSAGYIMTSTRRVNYLPGKWSVERAIFVTNRGEK